MASLSIKRFGKKSRILLILIMLIIISIITVQVIANSTINVHWVYKNDNYIVCQVQDATNGITRITNIAGTVDFDINLDIDSTTGGQITPLIVEYPIYSGAEGFKIWNSNNDTKTITKDDIGLTVLNSMSNENGDVISIVANNSDGQITKLEYTDGTLIKSFTSQEKIYDSINLVRSGTEKIKLCTSNQEPAVVSLTKTSVPPQLVYKFKNSSGKIAITAQATSGIYQIMEMDNVTPIVTSSEFETRSTFLFETTSANVLLKNGIGLTTQVEIPTSVSQDTGIDVDVTYEDDQFVIDASSETVGIWKITGDTENEHDIELIKYKNEPSEITYEIARDLNIVSAKIYNLMGNYTEVVFDKENPIILWRYIGKYFNEFDEDDEDNGRETIFFKAQDAGDSGLSHLNCIKHKLTGDVEQMYIDFQDDDTGEYPNIFESQYFVIDTNKTDTKHCKVYDAEGNSTPINYEDIKVHVDSAFKNLDGDKISIVASLIDEDDNTNVFTTLEHINGGDVIATINDTEIDEVYTLDAEHNGTNYVVLKTSGGECIEIYLNDVDYDFGQDEDPDPNEQTNYGTGLINIIKAYKSTNTNKIVIKAQDTQSGLMKITYDDGITEIDNFSSQITSVDKSYDVEAGTSKVLIWDRVGRYNEIVFNSDRIDIQRPQVVGDIVFDENGDDYTVTLQDTKSGLEKIVKEGTEELIYSFENDNYPSNATYSGKVSEDGQKIVIIDRVGNSTTVDLMSSNTAFRINSCTPRGNNTTDWRIIARDSLVGLSQLTYEDGTLICALSNSTDTQTIDFSVDKGTKTVVLENTNGFFQNIDLDSDAPEVIEATKAFGTNTWTIKARDLKAGLKSIRTSQDGLDLATFPGNTRTEESVVVDLPSNVDDIYIVDLVGNVCDAYSLIENGGTSIVFPPTTINPVNAGLIIGTKDQEDEMVIPLYDDTEDPVFINCEAIGGNLENGVVAIGNLPGIRIEAGDVITLEMDDQDVYICGGYTGSGLDREKDANYIHYPGIQVPEGATLKIRQKNDQSTGTLYVFGNATTDYGIGDGSAAAIGGYGIVNASESGRVTAQSCGTIEILSGRVVAVSQADASAKGTGAGIGGGGAYSYEGSAYGGQGRNIIIHDEATVTAITTGSSGIGANIGNGGSWNRSHRRITDSYEDSTPISAELAVLEITHVTKDDGTAVITVRTRAYAGLTSISLDNGMKIENFDGTILEETCEFVVNENRTYKIEITDEMGRTKTVEYTINDIQLIPAEEPPVEEPPVEETPGEETPSEETPGEETPGEETPAEETPSEEEPLNDELIEITESTEEGIKINRDCTIIFNNDKDNISYPGIMVSKDATVEIQGVTNAKMYAFGYGLVADAEDLIIGGTGAGIGGYGKYSQMDDAIAQDCGNVKILSGNIECYGGTIRLKDGTACATGAGIGGGGAYSEMGIAVSGKVTGIIENKGANLVAIGGLSNRAKGANIGSGGVATDEVSFNGIETQIESDFIEINKDTVITKSSTKGYRITKNCNLTFKNDKDILIGSTISGCSGIALKDGVQATISIEGTGNISVYGGFAGTGNKDKGYYIMYPGISVPKDANLTIENKTAQALSVFGGGVNEIPVSGAGIGTYGVYSSGNSAISNEMGMVTVNGGTINVIPKKVYIDGKAAAVGAGIGSGGAGSNNENAIVKVGKVNDNNLRVVDTANIVIKTDCSVKVGTGNILKNNQVIPGETTNYKVIDTVAPKVAIGRVDSGNLDYAKIKIVATDETSGINKAVLEDGTILRFVNYGNSIGSVYFKWYKNGEIKVRVYDIEDNYRDVRYVVSGLNEKNSHESLITIDVDNSDLRKINTDEYIDIHFKEQDKEVNMYVGVDYKEEELVHSGSDAFTYRLKVHDNCKITARMEDANTKEVIYEEFKDVSNMIRVTTNKIVNKSSNKATVEGLLQNLYKEGYEAGNIEKIGVYYRPYDDISGKEYNVSRSNVLKGAEINETSMRYLIELKNLRANTKYTAKTYIVTTNGDVIEGTDVAFRTRATGSGLTGRFYEVAKQIPTFIRQLRTENLNICWGAVEPVRDQYGNIIIDDISKGKIEMVGQIVPINTRVQRFKVYSNKDAIMEIGTEELQIEKGENYIVTKNIYEEGIKYPFRFVLCGDTAGEVDIRVLWLEDGEYTYVPRAQFYSKKYASIESAVVDNKDELVQMIDKETGKIIRKKVLKYNMPVVKLDLKNNIAQLKYGVVLNIDENVEIEGNILIKENSVIMPILNNVELIDYKEKVVKLANGSEMKLYDDVDVVGCIKDNVNNKIYDLCKYIQEISGNTVVLSDGMELELDKDVKVLKTNIIRELYPNDFESKEYQELMNDYATSERLVNEIASVGEKDITVGEAKLFETLSLKMMLSFEADDVYTINEPIIEIAGDLTNDRARKEDSKLKLSLQNGEDLGYATWRYMNKENGKYLVEDDVSHYATVEKLPNGNLRIKLNDYSKLYGSTNKSGDSNVMINLLLRVEIIDGVTKEDILENISLANPYTTYTKAHIKEVKLNEQKVEIDVEDAIIPIPMKIK